MATAKPVVLLSFRASRTEPDLEGAFLATGGSIGAAAARHTTDFALSSSTAAVDLLLGPVPIAVRIPLPAEQFEFDAPTSTVHLQNRTNLNITASRLGAGINGTLVSTMSGQASQNLGALLRASRDGGHGMVPLQYGNWGAHSCVVGVSHAMLVDEQGEEYAVHLEDDPKLDAVLLASEAVVKGMYKGSGQLRKDVVYKPSPHLSKLVLRVPSGVNKSGFDVVQNVVAKPAPMSLAALNSLLEHSIGLEFGFEQPGIDAFLADAAAPGARASAHAEAVASALSTAANFLVPYRVDGRTVVTPKSSEMVATESWLSEPNRTPLDADDWYTSVHRTTAARAPASPRSDPPGLRLAATARRCS